MLISTITELPEGCKIKKVFGSVNSLTEAKYEGEYAGKKFKEEQPALTQEEARENLLEKVKTNFQEANAILGAHTIVIPDYFSESKTIGRRNPSKVINRYDGYYIEGTAVQIEGLENN